MGQTVTASAKPAPLRAPAAPERDTPRHDSLPLEEIAEAIRGIRYGVVQVIIQDGIVIQIDKTEKRRLR